MFWNPQAQAIDQKNIDLIFMFNTNVSCPYSLIKLYHQQKNYKYFCTQKRLQTFRKDKMLQFQTYVQSCRGIIQSQKGLEQFEYQLFGSKSSQKLQQNAAKTQRFLVQTPSQNKPLKLAVISDWGPIITKTYKPLNDTLDYFLKQRSLQKPKNQTNQWRIIGLLLNGDYAYNLQQDHCQMYVKFLNQITRVTKYWPMIVNLGNRQSNQRKSMYLFQNSFVIGRLSTADGIFTRVQKYRFVNRGTFLLFDPFLQIYKKGTTSQYMEMKHAIQHHLTQARTKYPEQFMIMVSHYPVTCSQIDPHCRDTMKRMPDLFKYLSKPINGKGLVDLYIGLHMHQYQRIWPFVNNKFVNQTTPYYRGRLASFVQAVAGVDAYLIQSYYKPEYFSSFATYNSTGMGVLTFRGTSTNKNQSFQIEYEHIVTPNTYEVVDRFTITNQFKEVEPNNQNQSDDDTIQQPLNKFVGSTKSSAIRKFGKNTKNTISRPKGIYISSRRKYRDHDTVTRPRRKYGY